MTIEELKKKIAEVEAKSAVAPEMKAFITLVLEFANKSKEEIKSIGKENLQAVKNEILQIHKDHAKMFFDVSQETENQKKDFENKVKNLDEMIKKLEAIEMKDGEPGNDGYTPKKGEDYWTEDDKKEMCDMVIGMMPEEKSGEEIVSEINKLPLDDDKKIDASHIKGLPENMGGARGRIVRVAHDDTLDGDGTVDNPLTVLSAGAETFLELTDTPSDYTDDAGKGVRVNATADGLEFYEITSGTDEKVKYDAGDPTAGYVADKFVAGTGITIAEGTGADENKLKITNSAPATIDGSGTVNEIPYWVDANTLGSLAVATYPSLTELSYVKGLSSAIQTQLGNKQPLDSGLTSLAGLVYAAPAFVKYTGADTFTLDTSTYLTSVGTGVANEITYWSGTNTLGSLATATYPSLTELSYVKGVTSAIQSQLNGKQTTLTFGIADNNAVEIDMIGVADNDYAKFTANGLEGRSYTEVKQDLAIEGTEIKSTGEAGGTKFLREDGDGTCSWQTVAASTDEKVKYDAGDPTAGYVADKVIAGTGITVAEGSGATENKLVITSTITQATRDSLGLDIDDTVTFANLSGTNTGDVTVTDSDEIDFTLTGQQITAAIKSGSIDETKLDTSTNASLDLADGSVQKATYDAHTILYATTDNTPVALTVGEQTLVGRAIGGNISAIAIDSDLSSTSANDDTIPSAKATKTALDGKVPTSRQLTINGTAYDLSADRSWTISSGGMWTLMPGTPTRTGNTTFTVTGDITTYVAKGMIIKWAESGVIKVGMVSIPSTYGAPNTTITIIGDTMASIDASSLKYCSLGSEMFREKFVVVGNIGATGTDVGNCFYAYEPFRVFGADLQVGTAGTTNSTTIDINKGGTTMFTTKPTLATTVATSPTPFTADSATSLALGDKVTVDIDAFQTTNAQDLYVQLYLFPTRYLNL